MIYVSYYKVYIVEKCECVEGVWNNSTPFSRICYKASTCCTAFCGQCPTVVQRLLVVSRLPQGFDDLMLSASSLRRDTDDARCGPFSSFSSLIVMNLPCASKVARRTIFFIWRLPARDIPIGRGMPCHQSRSVACPFRGWPGPERNWQEQDVFTAVFELRLRRVNSLIR